MSDDLDRRRFLVGTATAAAALAACKGEPDPVAEVAAPAPPQAKSFDAKVVRVTSVPTAVEGNLLPVLIADFEAANAYKVELKTSTAALYDDARAGKVDLAISHYGHKHAEDFVVDGLGEWPRTVFSNQLVLVGPKADPAGVRGMQDAGEAFKKIADGKHPYLVNELDGLRYVTEILWNLAGKPERGTWLRDHGHDDALVTAERDGAYVLWGLTPFLRVKKREKLSLAPLVLGDPLFQRLLVSIVVNGRVPGVNIEGARAFQRFLLEPATQAKMRTIDYSEEDKIAVWVPAGRHNRNAVLPGTKG